MTCFQELGLRNQQGFSCCNSVVSQIKIFQPAGLTGPQPKPTEQPCRRIQDARQSETQKMADTQDFSTQKREDLNAILTQHYKTNKFVQPHQVRHELQPAPLVISGILFAISRTGFLWHRARAREQQCLSVCNTHWHVYCIICSDYRDSIMKDKSWRVQTIFLEIMFRV